MEEHSTIRTLGDIATFHAMARPETIALLHDGRSTTYAELDRRSNQVARGLIDLGLRPGARIGYFGKNSDSYFELMLGAARAGMVLIPVNWRLAPAEIEYILSDGGVQALFFGAEFHSTVRSLLNSLRAIRHAVCLTADSQEYPAYAPWRNSHTAQPLPTAVSEHEVALQLYTSGTTGRPKGALLTHTNLLAVRSRINMAPWSQWSSRDISLVSMPVFHIGGSGWGILGLYYGAQNLVVAEFDANRFLQDMERFGVSKLFIVPAALQAVMRHPRAKRTDFSSLRYIYYGGSPIPPRLLAEAVEDFGWGFVQVYGMTETSGTIVSLPPEDHVVGGSHRMRSAGKPLPGVEIGIIDESGQRLPIGATGEIVIRSGANMKGYWNLPQATVAALDADGWLRTGDVGYLDEDGYVYITDRMQDVIISGGENIYPTEVENAIRSHPAVADVAVFGVPDERWGEAVKAVVVVKAAATLGAEEIMIWVRERIARYKAPKSIDFATGLPRNASGKILRRQLRKSYWAGLDRSVN